MLKTILIIAGVLIGVHVLNIIIMFIIGERGLTMRESTKKFAREAGLKRILNPLSFFHGYFYFRWLKTYVSMGVNLLIKLPFIGRFIVDKVIRPTYHAKTLTFDQAKAIVTINKEVPLHDLGEQIIPYRTARDFVIGDKTDFAVMECACRNSRKKHCEPSDVCIIVGQPFVDFVIEHTPDIAHKITREDALEIIKTQHKKGNVQSVWFKDATLNRVWAICNCCKCCCAGIEFMNQNNISIMCSSGYIPEIDVKKCNACFKCVKSCSFNALKKDEQNKAVVLDWDKCMGCSVCADVCPKGAIKLVRDEKKGDPLDVRVLAAKK